MAVKSQDEMIDYVVALIDEVKPDDANGASELLQEAPVEKIVDQLENSATYVIRNAPEELLAPLIKTGEFHAPVAPGSTVASRLIINNTTLVATYVLPSDFKRLMSIKLSGWNQPTHQAMHRDDPRYRLLHNKFGVGSWRKPITAIVPFGAYVANEIDEAWMNCGLALELFKAKTNADTVEYFTYIPTTSAANMTEELQDPVAWVCASRVLESMREHEASKRAMERAMGQLQFKIGHYREER